MPRASFGCIGGFWFRAADRAVVCRRDPAGAVVGLPLGLAVAFLMALALIMILVQNPFYELILLPAWLVARELMRRDYNAVRIVGLWGQTKARSFDAHHWGGASPAPFPIRRSRSALPRGVGDAAW